jgi:hypothetical protein
MKKLLRRMKPNLEKGQSLVEMAITAPILIFMLLGVFEVGWALRGYLVLTNVNREITRFAVRQGYLNYSLKNNNPYTHTLPAAVTIGYDEVVSYTYTTLSNQLPLSFSTGQTDTLTSTLIISHIVVDTAMPCVDMATCNCNEFMNAANPNFYLNGTNVLTYDDLILYPTLRGYENFYAQKFPPTSTKVTQLNYATEAAKLARQNNKFNCELLRKSGGTLPASNNVIITEIHYNQPQLFGFPVISNPFTDPVPMYAHTAMRVIVSSRSGDNNVDSVGPICDAYPFALNSTPAFTIGNQVNILSGGWLKWNPSAASNQAYLTNELKYSRMVLNDFRDASDGDKIISLTDRVTKLTGVTGVFTDVQALVQKDIRVPVGSGNPFQISSFAWVRIENDIQPTTIDLATSKVLATYLGPAIKDTGGFDICLPGD